MQNFMKDRYGVDELTTALGLLGIALALVGAVARLVTGGTVDWQPLSWISLVLVLIALARAFSKNGAARGRENDAFRSLVARIPGGSSLLARLGGTSASGQRTRSAADTARADAQRAEFERAKRTAKKMWSQRKTSRFLKCPTCGQMLSVPKGKGKIRVTCPKCHTKMETKS